MQREVTNVRGVAFKNLIDAARSLHGDRVARELLGRLEGKAAEALRAGTLHPNTFYSVRELAVGEALLAELVGGGTEVAFTVGHYGLTDHLPRLFQLFLRALSPAFVIRRSPAIIRRYFDRGDLEVPGRGPNRVTLIARNLPGFDAFLWADFRGGAAATLEVAGARDVEVVILEGGVDDHAVLEARWR